MGLPWIRLETAWPRNYKVMNLLSQRNGHRAAVAYISGLCYCGEQGTAGYIPDAALPFLHATKGDARLLEDAGLWHRNGTGWHVNGWDEYQPSTGEAEARSARAKWLNCRRWHAPTCTCSPKPTTEDGP